MQVKVDWLSLSIPTPHILRTAEDKEVYPTEVPLIDKEAHLMDFCGSFEGWRAGGGRAPFKVSFHNPHLGATIYSDDKQKFSLFEFSGVGCDALREHNVLDIIMWNFQDRITRLDLAADFLSDTTPQDFAAARDGARFKSGAVMTSEKGTTVYVGSQKSDRYARVYRYNEPHPRAALLRCEMVLRDQEAKTAAARLCWVGIEQTTREVGAVFGWKHDLWKKDSNDDDKLRAAPRDGRQSSTVFWLFKQVLPALKRLREAGEVDALREFIKQANIIMNDNNTESGNDG